MFEDFSKPLADQFLPCNHNNYETDYKSQPTIIDQVSPLRPIFKISVTISIGEN